MMDQQNRSSFLAHIQPKCEVLFTQRLFSQGDVWSVCGETLFSTSGWEKWE